MYGGGGAACTTIYNNNGIAVTPFRAPPLRNQSLDLAATDKLLTAVLPSVFIYLPIYIPAIARLDALIQHAYIYTHCIFTVLCRLICVANGNC